MGFMRTTTATELTTLARVTVFRLVCNARSCRQSPDDNIVATFDAHADLPRADGLAVELHWDHLLGIAAHPVGEQFIGSAECNPLHTAGSAHVRPRDHGLVRGAAGDVWIVVKARHIRRPLRRTTSTWKARSALI